VLNHLKLDCLALALNDAPAPPKQTTSTIGMVLSAELDLAGWLRRPSEVVYANRFSEG